MTAPVFIFVCPACKGDDTHPPTGSRRWQLWEAFGLHECGDCGAQFKDALCVLKDNPAMTYEEHEIDLAAAAGIESTLRS